jgi:hypothetical protein
MAAASLFVFAQLTGWRALARRFPCAAGAPRESAGAVILGSFGWNGPPMRIGVSEAGVVLHPLRPFDIAFGKVCIPWSAVQSAQYREYHFFTVLEVRFGEGGGATIGFLPSAATLSIVEHFGGAAFVARSE